MKGGGPVLVLRWTWRDLRARWLQVASIALIIAIGSGTYSGLSSVSEWRRSSYDKSYELQNMYDLRVELADGSYLDARALASALDGVRAAGGVNRVEARLDVPTQVDASSDEELVLVPGRLIGVDVRRGGPHIGTVEAVEGRALRDADRTTGDTVVLDEHFAARHDLPARGTIRVSGGEHLRFVGHGLSPEQYYPIDERGGIFADHAVIYAPIETVQRLSGHPGDANQLVVELAPGARIAAVEQQIQAALEAHFPDVGITITRQDDDQVLRLLYDDIEGDQRFYDIFAILILAGAAFAAFNLTVRIVESQRREIGIGMALGAAPARLAVRPMLVAVQVALLGVVFGVGVGLLIDHLMAGLLSSFLPLPAWTFDFQPAVFAKGAAIGILLPVAAAAGPVWRAVRVTPVTAIRTSAASAPGGRPSRFGRRLPGSTVLKLPLRNVLRSRRRTILTALGIGAAITTLVAVMGSIDSFVATIDLGEAEIVGAAPDRLTIGTEFAPIQSEQVQDVLTSPLLDHAEAQLEVGGTLEPGSADEIDVLLILMDLESPLWVPSTVAGALDDSHPGVVLAQKAARDLGVGVGDRVTLRHPRRVGTSYELVDSELPVIAVHPNPYRFVVYLDIDHADLMALDGLTNRISASPAAGTSMEQAQQALFEMPGVVSIEPVAAGARSIRDQIEEVLGLFRVIEGAVLLMAALIAFNSAAINMDERRREHATMFAFGLPTRTVMALAVAESAVLGIAGTVVGVLVGRLVLEWLIRVLLPESLPDIGIVASLSPSTLITAMVLGTLVVAVAPLFTRRRLRRMDIPSTLRVME